MTGRSGQILSIAVLWEGFDWKNPILAGKVQQLRFSIVVTRGSSVTCIFHPGGGCQHVRRAVELLRSIGTFF